HQQEDQAELSTEPQATSRKGPSARWYSVPQRSFPVTPLDGHRLLPNNAAQPMAALGLDSPRAVRPGEELPLGPLQEYLRARLPGLGPLEVEQFPSGYSNLTYLLRDGDRELVLRRPPFG